MAVILEDWSYRPMPVEKKKLSMANLDLSELDEEEPLRLYGRTIGHPTNRDGKYIYVSPPAYFNEAARLVRTMSGSEYQLGRCGGKEKHELANIRADVVRVMAEQNAQASAAAAAVAAMKKTVPQPVAPVAPDEEETDLDLDSILEKAVGLPKPREFGVKQPKVDGRRVYDAEAEVIEVVEERRK